MKKHPVQRFIATLLIGVCLSWPSNALPQEAGLTNIIVTNSQSDLLLYLTVKEAFPPKIEDTILSGVPATFSFYIKLFRVRRFWKDRPITDLTITHTIKYDNLKKEYLVTRSQENNGQPFSVKSFEEAKKRMVEIDRLTVAPLDSLARGSQYQIRAKAELSKLTLPFYLHYILFFVSLWDFETDWHTIDFIY